MKNKLEELQELRKSAGITFEKSFRCQDAEKNIHLCDKDDFFAKIVKRLKDMGYTMDKDFSFEIVRYKFPYTERHHIGETYEWKYFYSTTFTITQELEDYLVKHRFIFKKSEPQVKVKKTNDELIDAQRRVIQINETKLARFKSILGEHEKKGDEITVSNYRVAIEKCKEKITNAKNKIKELEKNE